MPENSADKKEINWKNVLIGVIIGLILIGLGTSIYLLLQPKPEETTPTTTPKTTTTSAKKDETAGWKTYKDPNYMFELKYPPTMYVKGGGIQTFLAKKDATLAEKSDHSDQLVEIRVDNSKYRFDSYYNTPDNTTVKNYNDTKIRNRTINNYRAVEYGYDEADKEKEIKDNQEASKSGASVGVVHFNRGLIINRGDAIIEISTNLYTGEFKDTFDQILSTFKFLD